jgi:type I restriction enzyme S subunit
MTNLVPRVRLADLAADVPYPIGDGDHGQIKPAYYKNEGIPYIRVGDIGWGEFTPKGLVYISDEVHQKNLKSELRPGDILLAKTGATIGKCCIVPDHISKANTTSSVGKITLDPKKVLPKWVLYWFLTAEFQKYLWSISTRAAQPGFNIVDMKGFLIPLPPLAEQQRIVALLDEAFAGIDEAMAKAEANQANAEALLKSYLHATFRTQKPGWHESKLGSIGKVSMCKRILKEQTSPTGDIPFYKIGTFGKQADAFIPSSIYEDFRGRYPFPNKGDILISAAGTIGRRVRYDGEPAYFQDSNIVWIDNDERLVLNDYLYHVYSACEWNSTSGATISRLYNDDLRNVDILFPPSQSEQKAIAKTMDEVGEEIRKLGVTLQLRLEAHSKLKSSLLTKAFAGELTA